MKTTSLVVVDSECGSKEREENGPPCLGKGELHLGQGWTFSPEMNPALLFEIGHFPLCKGEVVPECSLPSW